MSGVKCDRSPAWKFQRSARPVLPRFGERSRLYDDAVFHHCADRAKAALKGTHTATPNPAPRLDIFLPVLPEGKLVQNLAPGLPRVAPSLFGSDAPMPPPGLPATSSPGPCRLCLREP